LEITGVYRGRLKKEGRTCLWLHRIGFKHSPSPLFSLYTAVPGTSTLVYTLVGHSILKPRTRVASIRTFPASLKPCVCVCVCVCSVTPPVLPPQLFDELAFSPVVLGAQSRNLTQLVWVTLSVKGADLVHAPAMVTIGPGSDRVGQVRGQVGGGQSMNWCWGC
jgi:hypothetical protein